MKQETTLYARPQKAMWITILLAAASVLVCGAIIFFKAYNRHKAYQEYVSMIPAADDVEEMDFYIRTDGTLIFYAKDLYSFAVLAETSQESSLRSYTVGTNTINAVFMPVISQKLNDLVLTALEHGVDIRNLYVPEGTDQAFLDSFQEKSSHGTFTVCSGGEYQLFRDASVYVLHGKKSLSLNIIHGNNSFLYSYDQKVGSMFDLVEATVCIMPNEAFAKSKISTNYVFLPESEQNQERLLEQADYYFIHNHTANIFGLSDGKQLLFDVNLRATGRLKEQ